jgi:hypothetical protein
MAHWVQCQAYTETRDPVWINLDLVASIRGFENGSVLTFGVPHYGDQRDFGVWETPQEVLRGLL